MATCQDVLCLLVWCPPAHDFLKRSARHVYTDTDAPARVLVCSGSHMHASSAPSASSGSQRLFSPVATGFLAETLCYLAKSTRRALTCIFS